MPPAAVGGGGEGGEGGEGGGEGEGEAGERELKPGATPLGGVVPGGGRRPLPGRRAGHIEQDGFASVAFTCGGALSLSRFERVRRSAEWVRGVVRAKGFLCFEECGGHKIELQQAGARMDARLAKGAPADEPGCRLVLIGQRASLDGAALLAALRACESSGGSAAGGCVACDEEGDEDGDEEGDAAAEGAKRGGAAELPMVAELFAARVRRDPRFELCDVAQGGAVVGFRLHGWLGVEGDELTAQLLQTYSAAGGGRGWLAPRGGGGEGGGERGGEGGGEGGGGDALELLQVLEAGDDALGAWADVAKACESVMMAHFGGWFCGGCDCMDTLAGKVLM